MSETEINHSPEGHPPEPAGGSSALAHQKHRGLRPG